MRLILCTILALGCSAGGEKSPGTGALDGGGFDVSTQDSIGLALDGEPDALSPATDPPTCAEAAAAKAYVGCDFWPTVVGNTVWSIFDYAVVVANTGDNAADIEVTGNGVSKKVTVPGGALQKIYLPWQSQLKGGDWDPCTNKQPPLTASVKVAKGAYHLVSSRPVTVYQFNALQYKGAGGEAGKSWAGCPGDAVCPSGMPNRGCFSFSNDASLLLPSTAMTGNYRVTGTHGWDQAAGQVHGAYVAITATRDGTTVTMKVGSRGRVLAGDGIVATGPGGTVTLSLNAGDVAQLVGEARTASDLSGSLVTADQPVQLIAGIPCLTTPIGTPNCDHVEESVFPAETLGRDYFVTVPTSPKGDVVGHVVRIYGNRDGTKLTYAPSKPTAAPGTINAGEVVDVGEIGVDVRITGDKEFAVGSFMLGATRVDPLTSVNPKGDPSMSFPTAIEQYRRRYIFLAPDDYDVSFVDIVHPDGATMSLDGAAPTAPATKIGSTGYSITRAKLGPGKSGAHELTSTRPVGIQVIGYGAFTSYQYPGGLDLKAIAPPPVK